MFPTQTVHVLSIQVVLLLPLFFPAWSFSSPPTPSLLKFRFDHTPQFLFRAHYLSYFSLYEILMVPKGVFIQLLRPFFCFCFFCSFVLRDISVRVTSVGLLYTREFNPPPPSVPHNAWLRAYRHPFLSSPIQHRPRLSQLCSCVA